MTKKKTQSHGAKAKHSDRDGKKKKEHRSAATVRRLKMYKVRPKRDRKGKLMRNEFQSKELPNTRIQPDRRWFGNTRVISQDQLQAFRDAYQNHKSNNKFNVILKEKMLPISLIV